MTNETTLCTAIEAGYLEQEVLLLAESLRRFGGRQANMPLVAIRPRKGPRIARATRKRLSELDVALVEDETLSVDYSWWAMTNKPAALAYVEKHAKTPNVSWIDGDMMVLSEPGSFAPPEGYDFIARAGEASDVASTGHDDRAEFWNKLCEKFGLDFQSFPEVQAYRRPMRIKAYWQGGLLTYRRSLGFSTKFREIYEGILDGDIASKNAGTYHTDQVSIALAVQAQELKAAQYDYRMNTNINPLDKPGAQKLNISDIWILQYHGSLWPAEFQWARSVLEPLPDQLALLDEYGPLGNPGLVARVSRKLHKLSREPQIRAYEKRVVRY